MKKKITFQVFGLDCPTEAALLKKALIECEGIQTLSFDYLNGLMNVVYDSEKIGPEQMITSIEAAGMKAKVLSADLNPEPQSFWQKKGRVIMTSLSGLCLVAGFIFHLAFENGIKAVFSTSGGGVVPHAAVIFYSVAILCGGYFVAPKAWTAFRHLRPDMNMLMALAVVGAILIGQWAEAATVTFLFSVALFLEHWSMGRARNAISSLLELAPVMADVMEGTNVITKPVEQVHIGARILVKPGNKIPLDGTVVQGRSAVNQATITGEGLPVEKGEGDPVYAGTLNEEGALQIEVKKPAEESTLARMIELVRQAGQKRAKAEGWVEGFAKIYTPIMMVFSACIMIVPHFIWGGSWEEWIYRGLVVLVIACPCALVISTPVTIVAGVTAAARRGVLIKGGVHLETAGKLKALAFDKTGTLTYGRPVVQRIIPLNNHTEQELLSIAGSLESVSGHPLAKAVMAKVAEAKTEFKQPQELQVIQGKGAEGIVDGKKYWIGSHRFLHEKKVETPEIHKQALALEDAGHSVIVIGDDHHVCGMISVADQPREGIDVTLQELKAAGLRHLIMLTGDNQPAAAALAKHAGIDRYWSELLPEDKVRMMQQLVMRWDVAGIVGDGVNDAAAMAISSLGIAMGGVGSDAAIEAADIALMADDLTQLPWLIRHAKKALHTIKSNIAFALGIKAVFLTLAVFGWATLWMAIAADTGASLLVVAYGLRLLNGGSAQKGQPAP
ncbi:MAG: heavy metal translocating P-type ATPase [Chlamydiia bacterium]|nr:heavy metal translocating P-type ATPase [Chlamydiia bacterium]